MLGELESSPIGGSPVEPTINPDKDKYGDGYNEDYMNKLKKNYMIASLDIISLEYLLWLL